METPAAQVRPNDFLSLLILQIWGMKGTWTPSTALIMGNHEEEDKIGKSLTVWIKRNHSRNLEKQWRLKRQNKSRDLCHHKQQHETGKINCWRQYLPLSEYHSCETPTKERPRGGKSKLGNAEPEKSRHKVLWMVELLWPGSIPSQTEQDAVGM